MADHTIEQLSTDPLSDYEDDLSVALSRHAELAGCFSVLGPIQICYKVEGTSVQVCLKLAGVEVACATLDPANPCADLGGNVYLAKANIKICLAGTCLTYEAQACTRTTPWASWECVSAKGTIICL